MVRVRFAPSPTGFLHQGNIRTALFNFLFVKKQQGDFILRIDDTDQERSKREFEDSIPIDLHWLGIDYNEGLNKNGGYSPYRQSERQEIYKKFLDQLLTSQKAYASFTTPEEIDAERRRALATGKPFVFRGKDRGLTPEEVRARIEKGEKPHYRFAVDREIVKFKDLVYGEKVFDTAAIEDFVIYRADGTPVYLFAGAVDDCLMKITHVIRGEDGMSNTPRQILIQQALGLEPPQFAHLPLILGPDHTLLSKRNGSMTVSELKDKGYLSSALVNYLVLLGWSHPRGKEIMDLEELIQEFDLSRVSRSSSIFDWGKLNHINQIYLRRLSPEEYLQEAKEILQKNPQDLGEVSEETLNQTLLTLRPNLQTFGEIPNWIRLILIDPKITSEEAQEVMKFPETPKVFKFAEELLNAMTEDFTPANFETFIEDLKKKSKVKGRRLFMPLRVILTGSTEGPELVNLFSALGKNKISERIQSALKGLQLEEPK